MLEAKAKKDFIINVVLGPSLASSSAGQIFGGCLMQLSCRPPQVLRGSASVRRRSVARPYLSVCDRDRLTSIRMTM